MKFRNVFCVYFLSIFILISCGSEQGNWTSVTHESRYIFGVWKASSTENAQEVIADVSTRVQAFEKLKDIQEQNGITQHNPDNTPPYLTTAKPETLLPKYREIRDWLRANKPTTYNKETLYNDRYVHSEIYPEIYHHYGFQTQAEVEYQSPKFGSEPYILLEIFDMGTAENAFGIFSVSSYPLPKFEWVGCKAILSGRNLRFWKGKYFIQIEGYAIATGIRKAMIELAQITAKHIKDPPQKIKLLDLLPTQYIRGSEKLFTTNWALHQINKTIPETFPQLIEGAIGVLAQYNIADSKNTTEPYYVFAIRFPNFDAAQSVFTQYRNDLMSENVPFVTDTENGAILIKE